MFHFNFHLRNIAYVRVLLAHFQVPPYNTFQSKKTPSNPLHWTILYNFNSSVFFYAYLVGNFGDVPYDLFYFSVVEFLPLVENELCMYHGVQVHVQVLLIGAFIES
jgi:hypothetical protein